MRIHGVNFDIVSKAFGLVILGHLIDGVEKWRAKERSLEGCTHGLNIKHGRRSLRAWLGVWHRTRDPEGGAIGRGATITWCDPTSKLKRGLHFWLALWIRVGTLSTLGSTVLAWKVLWIVQVASVGHKDKLVLDVFTCKICAFVSFMRTSPVRGR